jgi:thiamine biosynthesis lipoprotein
MMTTSPRSTRREFLQGRAAADALADLADQLSAGLELPEPAAANYLLRLSRRAMACQFEFFFNAGQYAQAPEAALAALDVVDRLEDQLSVFREHSEVSRLHRHAADEPLAVEPALFGLLEKALELHSATRGAYDVTSGPLSRLWGFTRRAGAVPDAAELAAIRKLVDSHLLALDPSSNTVRFMQHGMEINLGSIGKGYALDRAAALLLEAGIGDFLLHGGNSSVLARGDHGARGSGEGWLVGVRDPLRPNRRAGQLRVRNRALATSGSGTQFFLHQGRRYGHILDPRSGWPAEGVLSTSVLAPTAAEADALSTAFYVMGPEPTRAFCDQRADIAAVMFCPGPREGSVESHTFNLQPTDWIHPQGPCADTSP